jgi:VWFA-related protein
VARFPVCLPLLSASLCVASVAVAQSPETTAALPTLRAKARIVVIDVVVTDKQGNPVKNLKASDFALAENGAAQTINHFEAHTSLSAEDAAKLPAMPKLDPNIFTNYSPVPANGALNVLLFDALNTKMIDQSVVLQQMQKYLATPHPGVRMELFELNSELRLLQGFTSDQEVLRAALANRKSAPQASMLMANAMSDSWGIEPVSRGSVDPLKGRTGLEPLQVLDRQESTLQAMMALARYMGSLPGRKNLLWFSAEFPISPLRRDISDQLHETMALFARNQVAVYPIDARGQRVDCGGPKTPCTTDTMDMMAEDTGGKVFTGTNDIATAVEKAVDHGSNFYSLTYTPANRDWKGEFRKVEVKLAQAGYSLEYRHGYYAEDFDKPTHKVEAKADVAEAVPDAAKVAMQAGMEYGSPQPTDIVFKAAVNPATGRPENVVARANSVAPKVSGPFERYVVSIAALPTAFTFTRDTPGKIQMGAKLVTCVYTADGALVNSTTLTIRGDIDDARYQSIMAGGVKFRQEISVPVKGENFLRIGVEDLATNRMGVVEIPVAMVAKLKPLGGSDAVRK